MAGVNASLDKLRQTVDKISNPKDLKRRWVLTTWEDTSEGDELDFIGDESEPLTAGRLLSELRDWLEENDGDSFVHFEVHPVREGNDGPQ